MGAAAAAGAILAKEKRIVAVFRTANATSPEAAVAPGDLGLTARVAFRKLREHGVLREARAGMFYLDEASWAALVKRRRTLAMAVALVAVIGLLAALLFVFVSAY
jgi:hypothetical protein